MSTGDPLSRPKQATFALLAGVLVLAILELGAALLLGLAGDSWPDFETLKERRDSMTRAPADEASRAEDPALAALDKLAGPQSLHPFVGFTKDPFADDGTDPSLEALGAGYLEDRLFFEPSDERLVVAVVGGSVADIVAAGGAGLATELRRVERFAGREIALLSLAQGGFKQPQQLTLLAYALALGAHFDLVLDIDGFNEVALPAVELLPRGVFPFYPRGWDHRVSPLDSEARRLAAESEDQRHNRQELADRFAARPWRWSRALAILWRSLDQSAAAAIAASDAQLLGNRADTMSYATHGPPRDYASEEEAYADLAQVWYRASLQIHHLCRAQGIEYHHFLQPNQYLEGSKPVAAEKTAGVWLEEHPYRPAVQDGYPHLIGLGQELAAQGVAFHDLSPLFAERDELLYGDACCHLNFLGNTLLQREIAHRLGEGDSDRAENLSDRGLALEGYDPVSYLDDNPLPGRADLAVVQGGLRYRFANPENQQRFRENPQKYQPSYGGWCAFGMGMDEDAVGQVARERYPVDPESYEIFEGRLYLFFRSPTLDGRQLWLQDPEGHQERADATWSRIRGEN